MLDVVGFICIVSLIRNIHHGIHIIIYIYIISTNSVTQQFMQCDEDVFQTSFCSYCIYTKLEKINCHDIVRHAMGIKLKGSS